MDTIGSQVRLPMATAMAIALQGIKIRLGRALVTISGVVLGIAFLMSAFTSELTVGTGFIKGAVVQQNELKQTVSVMKSYVSSEIGSPVGKTIGVVQVGKLDDAETRLLAWLLKTKAAAKDTVPIRGLHCTVSGIQAADAATFGQKANLLLIVGDGATCDESLDTLAAGMVNPSILDTYRGTSAEAARAFTGNAKVMPIFGKQEAEAAAKAAAKAKNDKFRTIWVMVISLMVTVIGITNSLLMSVTERFKEIGTMKCLGALSGFIRQLFLIESALIGLTGSLLGVLVGALLPMLVYSFSNADNTMTGAAALGAGFHMVFGGMNYPLLVAAGAVSLLVGTLLAIGAAIYPANFAARMVPAMALRSNV
jgi:ABC-type antimicrobial peptide transport system permease subunit